MAEIAADYSAKPILEKIKEYVVDHVSYSLFVGDKVESLEAEVKKLKAKRKDVEDKIKAEEPAGMVATKEVEEWLESAAQLEKDAESVIGRYQDRNCIFLGSCSFNCWSNHGISVQAIEVKNEVADELGSLAKIQAFTKLPPPPPGQPVFTDTTLYAETASEIKFRVEEVLDFLRNDVKGMFGIWGMGGVGKTTILGHVNNVLARDPSSGFHRVILVSASRECTVEKLRHLIAKDLQLPEGGDLKNKIFNFLSDKSFVILLDDLWERLDLEQVGVPRLGVDENFKHKLILATRSRQVCADMNVRLTVRVECLSTEKGRRLFREEVGEELIRDNPHISRLADAVADECGGLPKALITVARSMANKSSVKEWVDAAEYLRKSKLAIVSPGTDDPLPLLKISYDYLKDPVLQECLLLCATWPEDFNIREEDIIECWMGRGLLGEFDTVGEAYKEGERVIDCLAKASLLQKSLRLSRGPFPRDHVRLHDLIRDMALWITRGDDGANERKWVVLSGVGSDKALLGDKKSWKDAHKLSLMRNNLGTLMPSNIQSARNLTDLMLRGNRLRCEALGVIQNLHELKYLDLSNNSLGGFPPAICRLNKLEYLNLSNARLDCTLPDKLKELTRLKYLLLGYNGRLKLPPRGLFSSLSSLEVLDLFRSLTTPTIIGDLYCLKGRLKGLGISMYSKAGLDKLALLYAPIRKLHYRVEKEDSLTSLHLFPRPIIPNHLTWSDLDYLLLVGNPGIEELVVDEGSLSNNLNLQRFPDLKEIVWKGLDRNDMIPKLHTVHINNCPELKHLNWIVSLPLLKYLSIRKCKNLKHIIWNEAEEGTEGEDDKTAATLYSLKTLDVSMLSMKTISNGRLHLPSLEKLGVYNCALKKLPFDKISSCSKLKRIRGRRDWWTETLELDEGMRTYLEPCFEVYRDKCLLTI